MFKATPTISALFTWLFFSLISITTFASIFDTAITDEEKKQIKSLLSDLPEDLMECCIPKPLFEKLILKTPSSIKEKTHIIFITHGNDREFYSYSGQSISNHFHLVIIAQEEDNSVIVYDPILKEWQPYYDWFLSFIRFKNDSDANTAKLPPLEKPIDHIEYIEYIDCLALNNKTKKYSPLFFIFPFSKLWSPKNPFFFGITAPIIQESKFNIDPDSNTNPLFDNTNLDESQGIDELSYLISEKNELLYLISLKPTYMNIFEARHLSLKSLFEKEVVTVENIHATGATAASHRLTAPQLSETFELFKTSQ